MSKAGRVIIILGASGSGKTRIYNELKKNESIYIPVYTTTRFQRINEVNGSDYFFVSSDVFEKKKKENEFIYTYCCHGFEYGIPCNIRNYYNKGYTVIIGVSRKLIPDIKKSFDNTEVVFVDVEYDELYRRIISRGRENDSDEIKIRLDKAKELIEWSRKSEDINYIVTNMGQFDKFLANIKNLLSLNN